MIVKKERFAPRMALLLDSENPNMKEVKGLQQEALQYYSDIFTGKLCGFSVRELVFVVAAIEIHLAGMKKNIPGIEDATEDMKKWVQANVVSVTIPVPKG